ncbi:precorrin-8X methylmutase [Guggenheimella bovis]
MKELERMLPMDIEKKSFEIISKELDTPIDESLAPIIKRVIHTTADFEYASTLSFSKGVLERALDALKKGATIVTDTTMCLSGINKEALSVLNGQAVCYIGDNDIKEAALKNASTRAIESMKKSASINGPVIYAIGNAPTALIEIDNLVRSGTLKPELIIGVPVGFVNVVYSKELIMELDVPFIVNRGRKGGSNVAASIVNALMYMITRG